MCLNEHNFKNPNMKKIIQILVFLAIGLLNNVYGQMKMAIPHPVQIYRGDGITSLVYELHMVDSLKRPVDFIEFSISSEKAILLHDSEYTKLPKKKDTNRYVKYIWIDVDEIPKVLNHTIKYKMENEICDFTKIINVIEEPIISIGLPVKGGLWYMCDGPSPQNSHRNHTTALKSRYDSLQDGYKLGYCNQRFAIDFEKVGENGRLYKDDGLKNSDHFCYKEDVYAVADGIVIAVIDSLPDMPNPPIIEEFEKPTDAYGNFVLQDIGNGVVASYSHFFAHSVSVHVGDTLKRGDFIGKIGSSGTSTMPHLHFHLSVPNFNLVSKSDAIGTFIVSEGISYVFDKYIRYHVKSGEILDYEGMTEIYSEPFVIDKPKRVNNMMPYNKDIIEIVE